MKKLFACIFLAIAAATSHAAPRLDTQSLEAAGFNELTDQEKAAIIQQVTQNKAAAQRSSSNNAKVTTQAVNDWLDIGERIGKGVAGAAKELGIAANEFAKTPVGVWTIAMLTWTIMGKALVHIAMAGLFLVIGIPMLMWIVRSKRRVTREYDPARKDLLGRARLVRITRDSADAGIMVTGSLLIGAGVIVSLLTA